MNPPPPSQPFNPEEIDLSWTDEQIIMLLHDYTLESQLPRNVLTDMDPFQLPPDSLPEGTTWYLVDTNVAKESAYGAWEVKSQPRKIDSNPTVNGWTTVWGYLKYVDNFERTNWLMHEYTTTMVEQGSGQEPRVRKMLCNIFQSGEQSAPNEHADDYHDNGDDDAGNRTGRGSENMNMEPEPAPVQNELEPAPVIPVVQNEPEPAPVIPLVENEPESEPEPAPVIPLVQIEPELAPVIPLVENEPEPEPAPVIPLVQNEPEPAPAPVIPVALNEAEPAPVPAAQAVELEPAPVIPLVQNEPEPAPAPVIPVALNEPEPAPVPAAQAVAYDEMVEVEYRIAWDSDLEDLWPSSSSSGSSTLTEEDSDPQGGFDWGSEQVTVSEAESEDSTSGSSGEDGSDSEEGS